MSKSLLKIDTINIPNLMIQHVVRIIDDHTIECNGNLLQFDYLLIIDRDLVINLDSLNLIYDQSNILTNYYQQSCIEHIYAINQTDDINSKLIIVCNHILNIE